MTKKREYVVSIFAAVHTAEDTEMEHPSPILVKIPVLARTAEEAAEKAGKAIAERAKFQYSDAEAEENRQRAKKQQRRPKPYNNPNSHRRTRQPVGPRGPSLPWESRQDVWKKTTTDKQLQELITEYMKKGEK
jgi:hypothetical protein